ncbi:flagellar hook-associated protein FlgK [Garciella nitratireducens]|uniref:Flagellar hook-associated protein 1 n=1 Tax=Garciella nitratireducens DSM 15102 TaxID=1121911 RepID=A0A1T4LFB4_9FIRM|nr:flagellar hook-associated protein FlgK [Garciella nitratireducens]SJZ53316.1 flagellar hook-associated protein 1 FlgK [Garciella nitratireducens DSM 15102]
MTGIFSTFNTAKTGMFAQQQAISTSSHNIANANTQGYSRQRVNFQATPAFCLNGVGMVGTGVDIQSIERIRDTYLDIQIRYETSISGQYQARQEILEQVEMIFMEPSDTGLNTTMSAMWDSWQELSKSPENSTARTIVLENSLTFTNNLNHMHQQLETLKNDSINILEKTALDANSILKQIQSLNDQIFKVTIKGQIPNDLLDQRDLLMDQLSQTMDFTVTEDEFGRVSIENKEITLLDGKNGNNISNEISIVREIKQTDTGYTITLVRGGDSIQGLTTLSIGEEDLASHSFLQEGAIVYTPKIQEGSEISFSDIKEFTVAHGELRGYQDIIKELTDYQEQLDGLARAIAYGVNMIHTNNNEEGCIAFFVGAGDTSDINQINAGNITINSAIQKDVRLIYTGKDLNGLEGDGERALAIAQLRNARLPVQDFIDEIDKATESSLYDFDEMIFEDSPGGTTFETYYKDIIAKLGISTQQANRMVENQNALTSQLMQRKYSISGVSIDEEVANLIQYQHAYQANAKVISTLATMLDTLINRMGV